MVTVAVNWNVEQRSVIQVDSPPGCEFEGRSVVQSGSAIPKGKRRREGEGEEEDSEGVCVRVYGREVEWLHVGRLNVAERC